MKEIKQAEFDGATYNHDRDYERLTTQMGRLFKFMKNGKWRTLKEISTKTNIPEASASAQLRNFRKEKFGGFELNRRHVRNGLFQYQLIVEEGSE